MEGSYYCAMVHHKNSLLAIWDEQAVFHHLNTDNVYLVTLPAAKILNGLTAAVVSKSEFRRIIKTKLHDQALTNDVCDEYIQSLLDQRLIKQLPE